MAITVPDNIMPLVEDELLNLSRKYPQQADSLLRAVEEFRILYSQRVFRNIAQLTTFCREVENMDVMGQLDPSLIVPIRESRRSILARIAQEDIRTNPPTIRDMDPDREIRGPRGDGSEGPRGRPRPKTQEELREIIEECVSLAAQIGEEAVVQILISLNRLTIDDIPRAIRTLRAYLGRSRGGGGGGGGILLEDDEILQIQSVRRVLNKMLLRLSYNTLVGLGGDTMERHEYVRSRAGKEARLAMEDLAHKAGSEPRRHRDLFEERRGYIEQAAALHIPDCFVRTIEHQGRLHPLPSWRQRIAIMEAQRQQHVIIGFEPGLGKTFIPVWLYQLLAEQRLTENQGKGRMLYVGPKIVMSELPNRIRQGSIQGIAGHSYYLSDDLAPTVGVITDGLDAAEIEERMNAEVVFCPYTMLNVVKDDIAISDRLAAHRHQTTKEPFSLFVADECHKIKGNGDWTERIRHIIHQTPQLYRDGNILFMSGTPATNTLADLRVISELLEPEGNKNKSNHGNNRRDRTLHPAFMRNMLERLVILDPPGDWQQHVTPFPYDLSRDDQRLVNAIARDSTLHPKDKIDATLRIIRSTDNMLGYTCAQLEEFLEQRHTVLIAENIHAQGVTREWDREGRKDEEEDSQQSDPIFRDEIIAFLQEWSRNHNNISVHFNVIDGKTNRTLRQREAIFTTAAESDRTGTSKSVILAHSSCLNEGIDLRFIRRMIALEWPWNSPELQQLLQRSLRAGNEDIFMTAFYAQDTLEQGIFEVAEDKYADVRACLYGEGISDRRLRRAGQDDSEISRTMRLLERLHSPEQREELIQRILHGRGMKRYKQFWERDRNRQFFREHLEQTDVSGIGDSERYLGSLVTALENASIINGNQYAHVHSRGLRLDRMLHHIEPNEERQVLSIDPIEYMLEDGHAALRREGHEEAPRILQGGLTHLIRFTRKGQIQKGSLDAIVVEGLENTRATIPASGALQFSERLSSLVGAVRVLRDEGMLILGIPKGACTQEEFGRLCEEVLPHLGLTVLNSWSGEGRSTDNEGDPAFRMFTAVARKKETVQSNVIRQTPASALQMTHWSQWGDNRERTRLENDRKKRMLPYQLVHTQFQIGRHEFGLSQASEEHAKQVVHLRSIQEGVHAVRNLAATAQEFSELSAADRDELLIDTGVSYLPRVSPSKKRPAFQLIAYPDYFFYPYDQQWNE